ncbi:MAG: hypothetical protein GY839_10170 [candidate division Zixibacteria bacterium]|nr:hypothetical protein [candidate division Zixibacteria bacterium]
MVKLEILRVVLAFLLGILLTSGCGSVMTKHTFYEPITDSVKKQRYAAAVQKIEAAKAGNQYEEKDRLLYYIDSGIANHYALNHGLSTEKLSLAEDAAEELFTKSIIRAAASLALNDNILEYAGEDYEILYTNLLKALNFLAENDFDEAFVEIRRSNEKLDLLEMKYKDAAERFKNSAKDDTLDVNKHLSYEIEMVRFNNDAFARYLSMHMYAAEGRLDDARIDYDMLVDAFESQPHIYDFKTPDVKYQAKKKPLISFVALAGLSPVKEAMNLRIRTDKNLQLIQVLYTDGPKKNAEYGHLVFPVKEDYYFKFSLPRMVSRPSQIDQIKVWNGENYIGELQLIEDVGNVAEETFKAKKSLVYFRTIARAIVKGLAAHKMKSDIDKKNAGSIGGWLMKAAVDVGTDVIENADLRCAHLMPGKVYVGDFEIEPGTYNFTIQFLGKNGELINSQTIDNYVVKTRGWNLVEAFSLN